MTVALADLIAIASAQFWQVTVVCILVAVAARLACRHRPHLAYLLWMLVVVKAITPPLLASPTGVFSWIGREPAPAVVAIALDHPTPALPPEAVEPRLQATSATPPPRAATKQVAPSLVESPASGSPDHNPFSLSATLLAVWTAGFCGLSAAVAVRWWRLRRRWQAQAVLASGELLRQVDALAAQLGVRRRVRLSVSSAAGTPAVFGAWRSTILLPAALVERMTTDELRPILAHELVHVRRLDPLAALLQLAAQLLWWFHPLIWWANRQARRERERACDEEVVIGLGCPPADYARTLLAVLEAQPPRGPIFPLPSIGMFGVTARRLEHIFGRADRFHRRTPAAYHALALFALALLLPGAGLQVAAEPSDADARAAADAKRATPAPAAKSLELDAITDADLAKLAGRKDLESLRIFNSSITQAGLKHLAGMKSLQRLVLSGCRALEEPDLDPLRSLGSLRSLELHFRVSAAGLATVARLAALEELTITIFDLDPAAVEPLARMTHLRALSVESNQSMGPSADRVAQAQVQKVRLRRVPLGDALARVAGSMPGLQTLNLQAPLDEKGLAALVAAKKLQSLALDLAEVDDQSLALVGRLTGLRRLVLRGPGKLSDAGLARLEKLTQLVHLELPAEGLTDAALAHLAPFVAIEKLSLPGGKITGTGLAALGQWKQLKTLSLPDSSFDDAGCRLLPQFAGLETLDLSSTKITDLGLESIAALADLRSLNLVGNAAVTDAGLAHLNRLKHLGWVGTSGTAVTPKGDAALKAAIPGVDVNSQTAVTYNVAFLALPAVVVDDDAATTQGAKPGPADAAPPKQPTEADNADRHAILEKLRQRGAQVYYSSGFPDGSPLSSHGVQCQIRFSESWKGTADDWKLLGTFDHPENLMLCVAADQLPGLAKVDFAAPLAGIMLDLNSGERLAGLDRLPACRSLSLHQDRTLTLADYRRLFSLAPDVQTLTLAGAPTDGDSPGTADGAIAEMAGHLKHLVSLRVNEPLSAAGLQAVGKLVTLKQLWIRTLAIAPADVQPLGQLAKLQQLDIGPGLVEVNLPDRREEIPVGDAIVRAVAPISTLRNLIVETHMSKQGLDALAATEKLQVLVVSLNQADDRAIAAVSRLRWLVVLHLSGEGKLSDGGLAPLEKMTGLVELDLPGRGLTDAGLKHLAPLAALSGLGLADGQFTGTGLGSLAGLKQLKYLELAGSPFDDAGCRLLPQFAQLLRLNLSGSKITDAGLASIAKLSNLAELNLAGTKITDVGLAELKPLKKLWSLDVKGTAVTQQGVASLRAAIPNIQVIDDSALSGGSFTFGTVGPVAEPLGDPPPADKPPAGQTDVTR